MLEHVDVSLILLKTSAIGICCTFDRKSDFCWLFELKHCIESGVLIRY